MPRYFFHRMDGGFSPDAEGTELPGIQDVRTEAILYAGETLKDHPDFVWNGHELKVEVTDETGALVFVVKISTHEPNRA